MTAARRSAGARSLGSLRLSALGITVPSGSAEWESADVVRGLLTMQAQDYPGTLWAIVSSS